MAQGNKIDFERIKEIDKFVRLSVYGYIRQCQKLLPSEINPYFNISQLIIFIILLYCDQPEIIETVDTTLYDIDDSHTTITKKESSGGGSIFGKTTICSDKGGIYKWKFKIITTGINMRFGISSSYGMERLFTRNKNSSNYAARYAGRKESKGSLFNDYDFYIKRYDIVQMELNLDTRQLIYYINDRSLGPAYEDIDIGEDIKYKLAIHIYSKDATIKLIDFRRIYK